MEGGPLIVFGVCFFLFVKMKTGNRLRDVSKAVSGCVQAFTKLRFSRAKITE